MSQLSFSVLLRFGILLFVLAWGSVTNGDEIQYATGFTPEKSEITVGEPIYLAFNLTNTGSKTILMSVDSIQWDVHGAYQIQAFDDNGKPVPDLRDNRIFGFSTVGGMTAIKPGGVYVDRLYLPEFIKFEKSGDYTVVASRRIETSDPPFSDKPEIGGSFSSRDKVNYVNTIREVEYLSANNEHAQSISVTNRFKLTVLPADPERLLKRANELMAKLDGIGARDMVAKPGGPRALDLSVDWNTQVSAWMVGPDNVDLHCAVRELSDIGDRRIIADLEKHLSDSSMKVRFACVKVLCALGDPLRAEWIVPIIKSRQWGYDDDPEQFVADHGGADAASILIGCMDLSDQSVGSIWNERLINTLKIANILKKIGLPDLHYHSNYDEKYVGHAGTPQDIQENAKALSQLQDWLKSHPVSN